MTEYLTESTADEVITDKRKSASVTFYTRRHESGRFCTLAMDNATGQTAGHWLACKSLDCLKRLLDEARKHHKS